ncbi:MAG: cobyrinate a,c-diamide synthase [Gammaproteobacteria bacterium]|nr:cobyrinate a,c-diamide synthase [Gammaproteobacteria bacterium]
MSSRHCPAVLIAAPASNQGKTTLTAALARYHRNQGRVVRVFKAGPDFLDPMIHQRASGQPVYSLDLWMVGEQACKQLLFDAAETADLIIIECGMGLHDGTPSSADLAITFGVPVLAVIDASSMAQTFGAIALGLANYRPELPFAGVIANRVASHNHANLVANSLPAGMKFFGAVPRNRDIGLPDRHLGLVQADEIENLEQKLELAASLLAQAGVTELPAAVEFKHAKIDNIGPLLAGKKIAIARDTAFAFIYPANIELLEKMGAELHFFSPLDDAQLPACDALWLPGGYPELHLQKLSDNTSMIAAIKQHHAAAKPIVAECGGMLYLLDELQDKHGNRAAMLGILPGKAQLTDKVAGLGMQRVELAEGELRGHTFHHSHSDIEIQPITHCIRQRDGKEGEAVYRVNNLHASYLHLYFASNPQAIAKLFNRRDQ